MWVHSKFSTYPQQRLIGGDDEGGWGKPPTMFKDTLDYLSDTFQRTSFDINCESVKSLRLGGGGG